MTHRAPSPDLERARSAATSPRDLERLETHRDARVRVVVAGNPNVPLGTLQRLSVRHASAVLRNPVLDLLTLENPNWLSELPDFARLALLRDPHCPSAWLTWALTRGVDLRTWQGVVQTRVSDGTPRGAERPRKPRCSSGDFTHPVDRTFRPARTTREDRFKRGL
ncbi:MAG: hypothetical protein HC933_02625 [Pleurocapsa sp. SU_196_0]|nr:hypothetical protein [Pleurocapsa sp. SU_196_0]